MYRFFNNFANKCSVIMLILFLLLILLSPSFSTFSCNVNNYINDTTPPVDGDYTCTSSDGVTIENLVGSIYCSDDPNDIGTYRTDKLIVNNSNIDFINCQLISRDGSNDITISNSQISMYGSVFQSASYESNATSQITSSGNNSFYDYVPTFFDIYRGTNSNPLIADGVDIRRDFEILNTSRANFTSKDKQNTIFSLKNQNLGVDMFNIYLLTEKIENTTTTNTFGSSFQLNLSFSTPQETSTTYSYFDFSSIPDPEVIQLNDTTPPNPQVASFEYNPITNQQELIFEFNEYISSLNVTLYNSTGDIVEQLSERSGLKSFSSIENIDFNELEEYEFQFEYSDYFGNSNIESIIVIPPKINNTKLTSQNLIIYNYSKSNLAQLNATITIVPQQNQVTTMVDKLQFPLNPSLTSTLNISNLTQINYTTSSKYEIPINSSFYQEHSGFISKDNFNSTPLLFLNNSTYQSTTDNGTSFFYSLSSAFLNISIENNSKITPQIPQNIYYNVPFQLNATYEQRDSSIAIDPSQCFISYNFLSGTSNQNMTYQPPFQLFNTTIFFNQYLPLEKSLTISCQNTLGLENISKTFTINQTSQPIDSFIYDLSYIPKSTGSFTTTQKELNISVTSSGTQNTDPNFDNQYFVMISKTVFPKTNWNTTQNITSWINIGKNEFVKFSHNDSNYSKSISLTLQNTTTMKLNDTFIFRDLRSESGQGTSLYAIVKSCVPPYLNDVCEFVSNSSQTFRFEDSTPPILYDFNIRNLTNDENFNFSINLDDLESDVDFANLKLTHFSNSSNTISLPITNYITQSIGLDNAPLINVNSIEEGILYNLSINTSNKNNLSTIINVPNQFLLDNQASTNSSLKLLNTSLYNTSPRRFYTNNGSLVAFNITSGFDNFNLYENNSGIENYNISIYSSSNDCSIENNLITTVSNPISDNQTQILSFNLTNNSCNKVYLKVFDKAGNIETLPPLEIIVDTTPPSFNKVDNINISLDEISTTKFLNKDTLNNDSVLFSYKFDVDDNLTPMKRLTINLYEKDNTTTGSVFSKVKQFNVSTNDKRIDFTLQNYSFKDGRLYRIGIIGENFAQLTTNEEISSEEIFLGLQSSLQIKPKGLLSKNENSFYYSQEFLEGSNYPLLFENENLAEIQCSVDTVIKNYSTLDSNQCSLSSDNFELLCQTPQSSIENNNFIITNCFIDNSEEGVDRYFSKNISFTVLNKTSSANVDFEVLQNRTIFLDSETINFNFTRQNYSNDATYILEQELNSPINNVDILIFEQKGENITKEELESLQTVITPLYSQAFFIFNNSANTTVPYINFTQSYNTNILQPTYIINFNSTINETKLNSLFNSYISNNQLKDNTLFTRINFNLSSNITNSFELNETHFTNKLDYNTKYINSSLLNLFLNDNQLLNTSNLVLYSNINKNLFNRNFIFNLSLYNNETYLNYTNENELKFMFFDYFTFDNNVTFTFNISPYPEPLEINSSKNFTLNLDPVNSHSINLSEYIINNNSDVTLNYLLSSSIINKPSNIETIFSNSSPKYKDIVTLYTNSNPQQNSQNIEFDVGDSYNSSVVLNFQINWNTTNISNNYNSSNLSTLYPLTLSSNPKTNIFEIYTNYYFTVIEIEFDNKSENNLIFNSTGLLENSSNTITQDLYDYLFSQYFNKSIQNINLSIRYETPFGLEFNQNSTLPFSFDINNNSIDDLVDNDLDSNGINDSLQSIIFNKSIVFNELQDSVAENFSNSTTSNFTISSAIGDSSDIVISWDDSYNLSNKWDFSKTQIYTQNKEFNGISRNGTRLIIKRFPKFNSNKAITLPALNSSEDIVYCLKDNESLRTSSNCGESDEYEINSCDTNIGGGISCKSSQDNSSWTLFNISNSVVEEICTTCDSSSNNNDDSSGGSLGGSNGGSGGGGGSSGGSSSSSSGPVGGGFIVNDDNINESDEINDTQNPIVDNTNNENSNNDSEESDDGIVGIINNTQDSTSNFGEDTVENNFSSNDDLNNETTQNSNTSLYLIILLIILLICVILGVVLYKQKIGREEAKKSSTFRGDLYSSITTSQKPKSLKNYTQHEREQLLNSIKSQISANKSLSTIAKEKSITNIQDIHELLNLTGFNSFAVNLKSYLLIHRFIDTNTIIEKLLQEQWFTQLNPTQSKTKYMQDLGFFITQFKMTQIFNEKYLQEIIADCIEEEINNSK